MYYIIVRPSTGWPIVPGRLQGERTIKHKSINNIFSVFLGVMLMSLTSFYTALKSCDESSDDTGSNADAST